ncbi:hypothetical protein CS542_03720 [Pedobacter sp. IW39]|nr:hypothetical protein CS542_03720 [Pedobacter sp. IW39]
MMKDFMLNRKLLLEVEPPALWMRYVNWFMSGWDWFVYLSIIPSFLSRFSFHSLVLMTNVPEEELYFNEIIRRVKNRFIYTILVIASIYYKIIETIFSGFVYSIVNNFN